MQKLMQVTYIPAGSFMFHTIDELHMVRENLATDRQMIEVGIKRGCVARSAWRRNSSRAD